MFWRSSQKIFQHNVVFLFSGRPPDVTLNSHYIGQEFKAINGTDMSHVLETIHLSDFAPNYSKLDMG